MEIKKLFFGLLVIMMCVSSTSLYALGNAIQLTDTAIIKQPDVAKAMVVSVRSSKEGRPNGSAIVGDNIEVKVLNLRAILPDSILKGKTPLSINLVIDGSICKEINYDNFDIDKQLVFFSLDTASATIKKIGKHQPHLMEKSAVISISISINGRQKIESTVKGFKLYFTPPHLLLKGFGLFALIIFILFLLAKFTNIMRIKNEQSPFSLAQAQLTFWTVVVAVSVIYIWFFNQNLPDLPPSILAILGISATTTVGSKFISDSLRNDSSLVPPQTVSTGFFQDILSDNVSTNIHRFQMVVWTIILGFIFLLKILTDRQLYNFDDSYLILTGISSGSYVFLKYSENKKPTDPLETKKTEIPT